MLPPPSVAKCTGSPASERDGRLVVCRAAMNQDLDVVQGPRWAEGRLPLVPALEEGASEGAVEQGEHHPGGRRFPINLDLLNVEGKDREHVAVPPVARRR